MPEPIDIPTRWREDDLSQAPEARGRRSRRRWTLALAVLAAALVGAVVLSLSWLRPLPHAESVALWVGQPAGLQPPAWAAQDREALTRLTLFARTEAAAPLDREGLARELAGLTSHNRASVMVVYLSARAECRDGEVRLLTADAGEAEPTPLRDVLRALAASPTRHKLLILELAAPPPDPRRGFLGDDVAAVVPAELEAVPDPSRLTLCPCAPGQTPMVMDDAQRSAFVYYLERGLRGAADGAVDGTSDRAVTARELAAYVRSRVERWAWRNREARQTPELYGSSADFALVAVGGDGAPLDPAERPTAYPDWLRDGWKARQTLADGEDYRAAPALLRLTDALLFEAERDWFDGGDEGHGADNLKRETARLEKRHASPPASDFPSLGAQLAQGRQPDAKSVEAVRDALDPERLTPPAGPAPPGPPVVPAEILAALKDKGAFEVAVAVLDAATEDAAPRPERLRMLDAVLRTQQPEPLFAEAALLRRLAELAARTGGDGWPAETVRRALDVARESERVSGDVDAAHVRGLLEAVARRRHEGETLLLACRGYAATADADGEFQAAAEAGDVARRALETMRQAQRTLDRARAFLPACAPYLEWAGAPQKEWEQAVQAACDLAAKLDAPEPAEESAVLRRNEDMSQSSIDLETLLMELHRPFDAERLAQLRERVHRPQAQASALREAEAVLATPLLPAEERGRLWETERALALRLHDETTRLDQAEDPRHAAVPPPLANSSTVKDSQDLTFAQRGLRRARVSLALLRLGGLGANDLRPAAEALASAEEAADDPGKFRPVVQTLAANLAEAWANATARLHDPSRDTVLRERLSWVWQPASPAADAIYAAPMPQVELRSRRLKALREQRADQARYESRDLATLGALPEWLARFYRNVAHGQPDRDTGNAVELFAVPAVLRFGPEESAVSTTLEVRGLGSAPTGAEATVRFLTPDERWFMLTPTTPGQSLNADRSLTLPAAASLSVPLRVGLRPDRDGAAPPPAGILAEARYGGRTYHRLLPVSLRAVTDRLEAFITAVPSGAPADELRLRPLKGRQPYTLFVRNLSGRTRNLTVRLADSGGAIPGGEAKISLGEHQTLPVRFAPVGPPAKADNAPAPPVKADAASPPAPPEAELPEFKGPLEVRLLEADAADAAAEETRIPVGIAAAREYTQVAGLSFTPNGGAGNRLAVTVRATPGLSGPPCTVELVLPGPGADGMRGAKKGTFQGELPADGGALTLFAEDVSPGLDADKEGRVCLNVDGRPRAYVFQTTFARDGDAVTPRPETRPALRLRAARAAPSGPRFSVGVEADNAPPGATLEVSLGRFQDGRFETDLVRRFPSAQRIHVGFSPAGPDGSLLFEASVSDWVADFDARRIVGRRQLRARMFDQDGAEILSVFQPVALDDGAPEDVSFIAPPKRARKDGPLTLTATARSVSGVAQATFFLGKPVDGKPPPGAVAVPARPTDPDRTVWTAVLPLKADKAGPVEVSVQAVNAAGVSAFATTAVELTDADPAQNDPGKIEGSVHEGAVAQPNLDVVLRDDKGAEKGRTKTKDDGTFAFATVAPGSYSLSVDKPATMRQGRANVTVEPGKTATAEIKLLLR